MRIVLDEEEILDACKDWLLNHHNLDVSAAPSCGVHVGDHGHDHPTAIAIFDTVEDMPRSHPYR